MGAASASEGSPRYDHCDGGTSSTLRTADYGASDGRRLNAPSTSIDGLEDALSQAGLEDKLPAAMDWCDRMGAKYLDEFVEDDFAVATELGQVLQLKPLEKRRLHKAMLRVLSEHDDRYLRRSGCEDDLGDESSTYSGSSSRRGSSPTKYELSRRRASEAILEATRQPPRSRAPGSSQAPVEHGVTVRVKGSRDGFDPCRFCGANSAAVCFETAHRVTAEFERAMGIGQKYASMCCAQASSCCASTSRVANACEHAIQTEVAKGDRRH
eukprot:gnl/TRDRNA2_/TRDRNA2_189878_c0_seq1.p1 gnl/TRDRNA2_/TRDRNA2_189878_c0~~gnl/TRDRNA2_/TRDRNA2_189878_c0_seq1.p1  ORF type:complete len:268 (-),score=26.21 gnl/TRDRNA2_/TRDRNA2_189878_c0_seq1:161-964(-)